MSGQNRGLTEAIRTLSGMDQLSYESMVCKVTDIDTIKFTCTCLPVDGSADFIDIPYNVGAVKGFVLEPKDGSYVALTTTSETTGFVSMVSEVNQIYLNGDNEGGLVKVQDLVTKLNDLENKVNSILSTIGTSWTPLPNDGGAALKALFIPPLTTPLQLSTQTELENIKIKHGS